ncbi:RluA family pseudouridine synthase [Paenibacillus naphthalenovorans]|uniref:Pseudouridine synthase n=1 Tax=Paenibacillus naphthalenovorans TaxID=162209 RepID=A0A0U2VVH8_9BACL|nr:RluA family pseudouridine synthase [Paenibacillus naphthalenovorans]ALS23495.1 pseudouridine synthase [Paenibacillus naphthalenovorans]SDJ03953.1 23S rRNA pseudouridine1911/1915/1917 synthase [Paenibacillus naphthalenovorans]
MTSYYKPLQYIVPPEDDGMLLRTVLQQRMGISRKLLSRLKMTEQGILLNGERRYIDVKVRAGDRVEARMEVETSDDILPQPIPLDILYEDEELLVLNKEAGRIVHPTHGHYTETLANGVVHYWLEKGERFRFRPVHRLDQETSGVLAVAKNAYVHQQISEQMQTTGLKKEYVALVHGVLALDEGTVDAPIDRDPLSPHLRIVTDTGYPSVTHYRVERRFRNATWVRLWLETGRTHQIRVHMKHLGHPLFGDKLYGLEESEEPSTSVFIGRHALHAAVLGLTHPISRKWMEFHAPLPSDIQQCLDRLESNE